MLTMSHKSAYYVMILCLHLKTENNFLFCALGSFHVILWVEIELEFIKNFNKKNRNLLKVLKK